MIEEVRSCFIVQGSASMTDMQPSADAIFLIAPCLCVFQVASTSDAVIVGKFPVHSEIVKDRISCVPAI